MVAVKPHETTFCRNNIQDYLEGMLAAESLKLDNQARFILEKIEGTIVIGKLLYHMCIIMNYTQIRFVTGF